MYFYYLALSVLEQKNPELLSPVSSPPPHLTYSTKAGTVTSVFPSWEGRGGWELTNVPQVWPLFENRMQISFTSMLCMG